MSDNRSVLLKVLAIVALTIVAGLSGMFVLLASICGAWSDQRFAPVLLVALAVAFGALAGIAVLVRSWTEARRGEAQPPESAEHDPSAEAGPATYLRAALWARILLSAAFLALSEILAPAGTMARYPLTAAIAAFAIHELPLGAVLWAIRERLERLAVWVAIGYSIASTLWSLTSVLRLHLYMGSMTGMWALFWGRLLLGAAGDLAVVVAAWIARGAMARENDADKAVIAVFGAFVYTGLAAWLTPLLGNALLHFRR